MPESSETLSEETEEMNIFQVLKELDISVFEYMAAPDMLPDGMKIMFILTMKAAKKAREHHERERIFAWRKAQLEKSYSLVEGKPNAPGNE